MASSSIVYGVYAPPASTANSTPIHAHLRTWLPVLACAMVFAIESTSYFGSDHTTAPLRRLAEMLCGYGIDAQWGFIHPLIRKTGHFMGYGIFSLVCFRGFWISLQNAATRLLRQLRAHGLAILVTFLIAGTDELHQCFLPNRCGQFSDVLLDTCGAVALGLMLFLVMTLAESFKQWREQAAHRRKSDSLPAAA
jgi:VanZ family protein